MEEANPSGLGPTLVVTGSFEALDSKLKTLIHHLDDKFGNIDVKLKKLLKRSNYLKRRLKTCIRECSLNEHRHREFLDITNEMEKEIGQVAMLTKEGQSTREEIKDTLVDYLRKADDGSDVIEDPVMCDVDSWDTDNPSAKSSLTSSEDFVPSPTTSHDERLFLQGLMEQTNDVLEKQKVLQALMGEVKSVDQSIENQVIPEPKDSGVRSTKDILAELEHKSTLLKVKEEELNSKISQFEKDIEYKKYPSPEPRKKILISKTKGSNETHSKNAPQGSWKLTEKKDGRKIWENRKRGLVFYNVEPPDLRKNVRTSNSRRRRRSKSQS